MTKPHTNLFDLLFPKGAAKYMEAEKTRQYPVDQVAAHVRKHGCCYIDDVGSIVHSREATDRDIAEEAINLLKTVNKFEQPIASTPDHPFYEN